MRRNSGVPANPSAEKNPAKIHSLTLVATSVSEWMLRNARASQVR